MHSKAKRIMTPGMKRCIRCHKVITNKMHKLPWCTEGEGNCQDAMNAMSFTGEDVMRILLAAMPPQVENPKQGVLIVDVQAVIKAIMIDVKMILPLEDDEKDKPKKPILLGL